MKFAAVFASVLVFVLVAVASPVEDVKPTAEPVTKSPEASQMCDASGRILREMEPSIVIQYTIADGARSPVWYTARHYLTDLISCGDDRARWHGFAPQPTLYKSCSLDLIKTLSMRLDVDKTSTDILENGRGTASLGLCLQKMPPTRSRRR
ncbi:hypothetical protein PC9H_011660 [Pleurotus ostreatus]|uniref:Secreted protein n=1 Tax=Pleurotus ostreatus TaxID=5322 RepID=A0A8H6ZLX2_PLEOS|nr:uncharacterized protein PC9H_011660 [Pleurotus ostreatus]KAF7421140.1 hypothetical protein PC9H_011660 [Pleurotus ostreatus]